MSNIQIDGEQRTGLLDALPAQTQGRYEHLDSDEYRFPDGMQRVGYDADTQVYTFRDADGSYWESEEGNRYGELHRAGAQPRRRIISRSQGISDWRYLAPFLIVCGILLLLLFRFVNGSAAPTPAPLSCGEGLETYAVAAGDTCWRIAEERGSTVEEVISVNDGLDCDALIVGKEICLPMKV